MDIIKQLRKQKVEISKVITNIREVQEQINVVSAKLKRTEVLADEQIYQVTNSPRLCRVVLAPTPQLTRVVACTDRQGVQGGGPRRVLPPLVVPARRASSCLCCMPGGHTLTCFVDCSCVCVCVSVCVCPPLVPQIFSKLIGIARASGRATNAERDLEARADQLQASTSARNMERLLEDLAQVRKENAEIKAALKAAKAR